MESHRTATDADLSREGAKCEAEQKFCASKRAGRARKIQRVLKSFFGVLVLAHKMESFRYLYSMISQNYEENPPLGRLGFVTFLFASK